MFPPSPVVCLPGLVYLGTLRLPPLTSGRQRGIELHSLATSTDPFFGGGGERSVLLTESLAQGLVQPTELGCSPRRIVLIGTSHDGTYRSYQKAKPGKLADGTIQNHWYLCEGYCDEKRRPRERVLKYIDVNPNVRTFPLDEALAGRMVPIVASPRNPTDIMNLLKEQGFEVSFRPRQVQLINNPPLRRLSLRIE